MKDSKVSWTGVSGGTEGDWWGEKISLPVNAVGDIILESLIRQKWYGPGGRNGNLTIGFGGNLGESIRYGGGLSLANVSNNYKYAINSGSSVALPSFPSKNSVGPIGTDVLTRIRISRINGYISVYIDNTFLGKFAYAPAITTVDIVATFKLSYVECYKSVDWIRVTPSAVVNP